MNERTPIPPTPTNVPTQIGSGVASAAAQSGSQRYGRFALRHFHAKGGLGEVHVAVDDELRREVALKRMQDRCATDPAARRRFVNEAELTARLEHPGIVPIYGLVQDENGQPCYAMRFIEGESLAEAIKRFHEPAPLAGRASDGRITDNRPSLARPANNFDSLVYRQLLQRFISVCNTIAYAHSKRIIHRDLKPSNVMLGPFGETLVVDWGLAREFSSGAPQQSSEPSAVEEALPTTAQCTPSGSDDRIYTQAGQALGTPGYMAPEQATGRWNVVGPCSDVYGLGATLYELLTGQRPIRGRDQLEALQNAQAGRFPPPRKLKPEVPKPLEAACLKAMDFDPAERYATAKDLADDLEHWLADEPVAAYRERWTTAARRWMRRHRTLVTGASVALLVLAASLSASTALLSRAYAREAAEHQAAETAAKRESAANEVAQKRLQWVVRNNDILTGIFRDLDPRDLERQGIPLGAHLGTKLKLAASNLDSEAAGDAVTAAHMQRDLGVSLRHLGYAPDAVKLLVKARTVLESELGPDHPDTLACLNNLAAAYQDAGERALALPLLEQTLNLRKKVLGPSHPETLVTKNNLASAYQDAGRLDKAVPLYEETLAQRQESGGAEDPDTLELMHNLATAYLSSAKTEQALELAQEVVKKRSSVLGPDHPDTLFSMNNLAGIYRAAGAREKAVRLWEQTLAKQREKLHANHPDILLSLNNLAATYHEGGEHEKALPLLEECLLRRRETRGPDHPETLLSMNNLAWAYRAAGRFDKAIPLFEETLTKRKEKLGPDHPDTVFSMGNLGSAYLASQQGEKGAPILRTFLEKQKSLLRDDARQLASIQGKVAQDLLKFGRPGDAESVLRDCLAIREKELPQDWTTFATKALLGEALLSLERYSAAEPLLLTGYDGMSQRADQIPSQGKSRITQAIEQLIHLYDAWGKPQEAAKWRKVLEQSVKPARPVPGDGSRSGPSRKQRTSSISKRTTTSSRCASARIIRSW